MSARLAFTVRQRVAIAELLALGECLRDAAENAEVTGNEAAEKCNLALGVIVLSRAFNIAKRQAGPLELPDADIREFVESWEGATS